MNEKIEKMINDQMNFEIYSAYIYMAMGAYCDSIDLEGFAHWFKTQAQEEMYHAIKMYNYVLERTGRPFFTQIDAPAKEWGSLKEAFQDALKHEKIVTDRINKIMTTAIDENDHASRSFLNWFVDEQVEEEASVDAVIKKFNLIKDSGQGLFMLDKEMATRVFTTPPDMKL